MSDYKDLSYAGPKKDIEPTIGSARSALPMSSNVASQYHSLDKLKINLEKIINDCEKVLSLCKDDLSTLNLKVEKSTKLSQASSTIWSNLSSSENGLISFDDFLTIRDRKDRASLFVSDEYEKLARGGFGNGSIDIYVLANVLISESNSIVKFLQSYLQDIYETFDQRIMEILCQWSINALRHVSRLSSFFSSRKNVEQYQIPQEEISNLTSTEASRYQALFTVKNNTLNQEIKMFLEELKNKYLNNSDTFYLKFLGPTLNLRLNTLTNLQSGKKIGNLPSIASDALDDSNANIVTLIKDTSDRSSYFNNKIIDIEERIALREKYISYIKQLSTVSGKTSKKLITNKNDKNTLIETNNDTKLISDHKSISVLEGEIPHPQYLNKFGDTLSGDLNISENIKIAGIIPSKHSHNGLDGGTKISGKSIVGYSANASLVNSTEIVFQPKNLKNISYKQGNSKGVINVLLNWDSDSKKYLHEINFTNISNYGVKETGLNEQKLDDNYIPPFEANAPLFIDWLMDIDNELFFN